MRGITKPWPPTRRLSGWPGADEPASRPRTRVPCGVSGDAARDQRTFARSEFDRLDKRKLRRRDVRRAALPVHLLRAADRRRGHPARASTTGVPSAAFPSYALHWKNLYLSCPSSPRRPATRQKGRPAPFDGMTPIPHALAYVDLRYEGSLASQQTRRNLRPLGRARLSGCHSAGAGACDRRP